MYIYIYLFIYLYICIYLYIYIYPIAYIHYMSPVNPDWNPPKPCFLSGWLLEFAPISKPRGALISSADRVPTRVSPAKSMGNHGSYHPEMDGMLYIYIYMYLCVYIYIYVYSWDEPKSIYNMSRWNGIAKMAMSKCHLDSQINDGWGWDCHSSSAHQIPMKANKAWQHNTIWIEYNQIIWSHKPSTTINGTGHGRPSQDVNCSEVGKIITKHHMAKRKTEAT